MEAITYDAQEPIVVNQGHIVSQMSKLPFLKMPMNNRENAILTPYDVDVHIGGVVVPKWGGEFLYVGMVYNISFTVFMLNLKK